MKSNDQLNAALPNSVSQQLGLQYKEDQQGFVLDSRGMAFWVGLAAFALPTICILGATLAIPFGRVCFANSISHFYFTRGYGDVFVGILIFIAIYLFNFRGKSWLQNAFASLAAIGAICVAVFPTSGVSCEVLTGGISNYPAEHMRGLFDISGGGSSISYTPEVANGQISDLLFLAKPLELGFVTISASTLHFGGAAVMFVFLAWYAMFQFIKDDEVKFFANTDAKLDAKQQTQKNRNSFFIYSLMSSLILLAICIIIAEKIARNFMDSQTYWEAYNGMFWMEALALYAFGYAWLHYGQFINRTKRLGLRVKKMTTGK